MNRREFRNFFETNGPVVLPVIHVLDETQTKRNIQLALNGGCKGVFLINHDFDVDEFLPIIESARKAFPDIWLAVNFLAVTGKHAFPVLSELESSGTRIDGYWGDDARIDEHAAVDGQMEASEILKTKRDCGWDGMYFGGTAFKKQREVSPEDYSKSAELATHFMDVVTTSGVATGHAADTGKIETFRKACEEKPIALASGITPENVHLYSDFVDCMMVATGINIDGDFYNIDPNRLTKLMSALKEDAI